jgi:hypothetical protein
VSAPVTVKLKEPVPFGTETIDELELKRNAKSMRNFALPMKPDGTILFEPYELAKVGVHMAGRPNAVLDMLDPSDVWALAQVVMDFFVPGQTTGSTPSA